MRSSSIAARGRTIGLAAAALVILSIPALAWAQAPASEDSSAGATATPAGPAQPPAQPGTPPGAAPPSPSPNVPPNIPVDQPPAPPSASPEGDSADTPVNLRLRRLEQRVQALKERAWRAKARVGMLKEAVLGGGVGATASILHVNKMGSSYRLLKLVYALDGTQIFARSDDSGALHENKELEVLTGPIAPGSHTLTVLAIYRGHGYGVFKYLDKYRFTVRSSHTFTVSEGKATHIEAVAFERGSVTTPMDQRPAVDFKVSHSQGPGGS